jgi:hypothetical protein
MPADRMLLSSRKIAQDPCQSAIEIENRFAFAAKYLLSFPGLAGLCEVVRSLGTIEGLGGVRI